MYIMVIPFTILLSSINTCTSKNRKNDTLIENVILDKTFHNSMMNCDSMTKISLELTTLKTSRDSITFNYRITNKSQINLLIYHLQYLNILLSGSPESEFPMCNIYLINNSDELPKEEITIVKPEELPPEYSINSYVLLPTGKMKEFRRTIYIGDLVFYKKDYMMKLKYLPPKGTHGKWFYESFKKERNENPKLKEYEIFECIIESNICPITIPKE